jgi:thiol:disulfide interchange protein DsbD
MQILHPHASWTCRSARISSLALVAIAAAGGMTAQASAQLVPSGIPKGSPTGSSTGGLGGIAAPPREPQTGEDAVKVSTAVVGEAKPGATVRVAVTFDIHPGWHIYWENPGESGSPTDLAIELPSGCSIPEREAGKPRIDFPIPQIFSHGETTFGYEKQVTLSFPVTLAADLSADALKSGLAAKLTARWLVCKERCLMGSSQTSVDLAKPVDATAAAANRLAESLERVPKPLPTTWKVTLNDVADDGALLILEAPAPSDAAQGKLPLTFIPFDTPGVGLAEGYVAESKDGRLEVDLALSRESALGKRLEVGGIVLVGERAGNLREAYAFRIPVPAAAK